MRIYWNTMSVFGWQSNPVPGFAREKLHAAHQHSFLLSKFISFLFHSLAYLVFNLFSTKDILRCICISLECHWVPIVLTHRKKKWTHFSSIIFWSQWDLCFYKLSAWKNWNMYPMDDLELRMEFLDDIVKISELFTHLCEFCMAWLHSFPWFPQLQPQEEEDVFSWPGYISSAETQEGLNTPNSLWPGWSWLTLLRGILVFLRGLVFPLSKPSRYFKGVLIIWCSKAIKSETKHHPNVIFASFFIFRI